MLSLDNCQDNPCNFVGEVEEGEVQFDDKNTPDKAE